MKTKIAYKTTLILVAALTCEVLHAAPIYDSDLQRLTEDYNKALAASTEPVQRRYLASLHALQSRATAGKDLDTAVKIKAIIEQMKLSLSGRTADIVGTWELRNLGNNSVMQCEFKADGTFVDEAGKQLGKWELKGKQIIISWETQPGLTDHYELPVKDGKLTGKNSKGASLVLAKKTP